MALGTALWGWGTAKKEALAVLDSFYDQGYRYIDTAFNYPINENTQDLLASGKILGEWIKSNKVNDLKIIYKAGTTSNQMSAPLDLSDGHLKDQLHQALDLFSDTNMQSFMIHFDNGSDDYPSHHFEQLMQELDSHNIHFGLSGIKNPSIYKKALPQNQEIYIEGKYNILFDDTKKYEGLYETQARLMAYGISVSGLKLKREDYSSKSYVSIARSADFHDKLMNDDNLKKITGFLEAHPYLQSMYEIGIYMCETHPNLYGYIVGPRNPEQWLKSLASRKKILERLNT